MASKLIVLTLARGARRRVKRLSQVTRDKTVYRWCQILLKLHAGWRVAAITQALGCHRSTIHRLRRAYQRVGERSLIRRTSPGRPRKVTPKQDQTLVRAVAKSPRTLDQNFSNWTAAKLRTYLDWTVHAVTVWRHLMAQGWRWRRPALRVTSPDPRYWAKRRYLQALMRQARRGDIHLYFIDEMDLALLPTVSGCWRPVGQQRQVATPGQNQKEYIFGAAHAVTGTLVWLVWPRKNNVGFRELLKHLLAEHQDETRPIVVVADNFRIHKAKAVREMLAKVRNRLRVWFLPTYAPQLNPIERVWRHCRRSVTDNIYFKTMKRLLNALSNFLDELAASPVSVQRLIVA
jgi:transposase